MNVIYYRVFIIFVYSLNPIQNPSDHKFVYGLPKLTAKGKLITPLMFSRILIKNLNHFRFYSIFPSNIVRGAC